MKDVVLSADCEKCYGLCCVGLAFTVSIDFSINKEAGSPCPNLREDYHCSIHSELRDNGFRGCTAYDCLGAGQYVVQQIYEGKSWKEEPRQAGEMFHLLLVIEQLHEICWYLKQALLRKEAQELHELLNQAFHQTAVLRELPTAALLQLNIGDHRRQVDSLLAAVSQRVRSAARSGRRTGPKHRSFRRGENLMGADLRKQDLVGANLRGTYLIGVDLRNQDLSGADFIGADLRDADLSGADLSKSIHLTQTQVNAAKGNIDTRLPGMLIRPKHWQAAASEAPV